MNSRYESVKGTRRKETKEQDYIEWSSATASGTLAMALIVAPVYKSVWSVVVGKYTGITYRLLPTSEGHPLVRIVRKQHQRL